MKHLTSQELSAHLDHALSGRAHEQAERHLASCEQCRGALAALAAQDALLRPALTHDPGDVYFESFAGRVEDRVRAAGLAGAQARGQGSALGQLFRSPRALAWAGGAAAIIAAAGLALMTGREVRPPDLRDRDLAERAQQVAPGEAEPMGSAPPATALSPSTTVGDQLDGEGQSKRDDAASRPSERTATPGGPSGDARLVEPDARGRRAAAPSATSGERIDRLTAPPAGTPLAATPGRAYQVRRNEAGEDVPVRTEPGPAPAPTSAALGGTEQVRKKLAAEPLKDASVEKATRALAPGTAKEESAAGDYAFAKPPATGPAAASPSVEQRSSMTGTTLEREGLAAGEARLCGDVRDAAGRPVAGAQVSVADVGRTATTDARGAFCVTAPAGEHPLSVMAVGFAESRQTVRIGGDQAAVRVTLRAISVLEGERGGVAGRMALPRAGAAPTAEPADAYAALPDSLRAVVRAAQQLESSATARRSAGLFDAAAAGWERALRRLAGGPLELETRRHLAETRYRAWEAGPTGRRAAAAVEALTAYAVRAPAGAERDQATRWLDRVKP